MTRTQWSWAAYDWANSAFATTVLVGLFPVLFNTYYARGVDPGLSTFYLGVFGNSLAAAVVMLLAPTLGVIADRRGWKKPGYSSSKCLGTPTTSACTPSRRAPAARPWGTFHRRSPT